MIAYSTLGTNDMDRSIAFYDAVFGALGVRPANFLEERRSPRCVWFRMAGIFGGSKRKLALGGV